MCQAKCGETQPQANNEEQAIQTGVLLGVALAEQAREDAVHATDKDTVRFEGSGKFIIKPFATLDDAVVSGAKIGRLVYPDSKPEAELDVQYQSDLLRAVSMLNVAKPDERYSALVSVLGLVLMGFDPDDLEDIKADLNKTLAVTGREMVRQNTEAFLKANGFGEA